MPLTSLSRKVPLLSELPLLLTGRGQVQVSPQGRGQLIGLFEQPDLDENSLRLAPGANLLLFTDGRDPAGKTWDHNRLDATVRKLRALPTQETCDRLLQALRRFQSDAPQEDDISLVVIHAEDITVNVLKALELDRERRIRLVDTYAPALLRNELYFLIGLVRHAPKSTPQLPNRRYRSFILRKA